MKKETVEKALNEISDKHLEEALKKPRRPIAPWVGAVAAVLALVFLMHSIDLPVIVHAKAIAEASPSRVSPYPRSKDYEDLDQWRREMDRVDAEQESRARFSESALQNSSGYFKESSLQYLADSGNENRVWSPVNGFAALAMLAEAAAGDSRQEILDLLHVSAMEELRQQVSALWENVRYEDGQEISKISNSLWLHDDLSWNQDTADRIAHDHYASVYQGDLNSKKTQSAVKDWVNRESGGLMKEGNLSFPENLSMVLASTAYLHSKWSLGEDFSKSKNTEDIFHSPEGDVSCTFMHRDKLEKYYFWGDSFGAVPLSLRNGCSMWLILPDEGKAPEDVLREGQYFDIITDTSCDDNPNSKYMYVNLTMPKFDIHSECNLKQQLQEMGLQKIFQAEAADFSSLISSGSPVWVDSVQQAARIQVDEEGVTAGSYLVIPGAGAMQPPEDTMDFVLDRPFLFAVTRNGVPMFTGIVNNPL